MANPEGWIKVWRKLEESDVWSLPPLTLRVSMWLLLHANSERKHWNGFTIEPGELITSYAHIAKGVQWVEGRQEITPTQEQIRWTIKNLKKAEFLAQEPHQGGLHIKVLHWEQYQGGKTKTTPGRAPGTTPGPPQDNPNQQELQNEEVSFVRFWNLYPRKTKRPYAQECWGRAIKKADPAKITAGLEEQLPQMEARIRAGEAEWVSHPSTWLNNERWNDTVTTTSATAEPTPEQHRENLIKQAVRRLNEGWEDWQIVGGILGGDEGALEEAKTRLGRLI
jgi:hypothetical protein